MIPRSEFDLEPWIRYLNNASTGVVPRVTATATKAFVDEYARLSLANAAEFRAGLASDRERIAELVGARSDEIALVKSTTEGAQVIADCIDWKTGDDVILSDGECLSNVAWLRLRNRGVNVRIVNNPTQRLDADCLRSMLTARTKVVAVSWVTASDGYRHDLAALGSIAQDHGAWFLVDAIQGLGAFPIDVKALPCDALYSGAFKWLMGFRGAGFLYLHPRILGISTQRLSASRSFWERGKLLGVREPEVKGTLLETGGPNGLGTRALATSIGFLKSYDARSIANHILQLTDRLVEGLLTLGARVISVRDGERRSGIVTFAMAGYDQASFDRHMRNEGIIVSSLSDAVRVSPHAYNTADEIDAFLECLSAFEGP